MISSSGIARCRRSASPWPSWSPTALGASPRVSDSPSSRIEPVRMALLGRLDGVEVRLIERDVPAVGDERPSPLDIRVAYEDIEVERRLLCIVDLSEDERARVDHVDRACPRLRARQDEALDEERIHLHDAVDRHAEQVTRVRGAEEGQD